MQMGLDNMLTLHDKAARLRAIASCRPVHMPAHCAPHVRVPLHAHVAAGITPQLRSDNLTAPSARNCLTVSVRPHPGAPTRARGTRL
jgi:hypothetical protein